MSFRVLASLLLGLTFCLLPVANAADDSVLAVVNGQKIAARDLEFLYLSRRVPKDVQESVRQRFVEDLIDRALLRQFLAKRKVEVSKVLLDQQLLRIETVIKGEELDVAVVLKSLGFTRETLREELALPLRWRAHAATLIDDAVLKEYWGKHRIKYDGTQIRAAQVVKRIAAGATAADIEKSKAELATLRARILKMEITFAEAAKQQSDSPSAKDGGDLGAFEYRGRMLEEFTQVGFRLKPGEVSDPFQTQFGLHLLTVTEIVPGNLSLEDARPELFDAISSEMQERLLKQLRQDAKLERK